MEPLVVMNDKADVKADIKKVPDSWRPHDGTLQPRTQQYDGPRRPKKMASTNNDKSPSRSLPTKGGPAPKSLTMELASRDSQVKQKRATRNVTRAQDQNVILKAESSNNKGRPQQLRANASVFQPSTSAALVVGASREGRARDLCSPKNSKKHVNERPGYYMKGDVATSIRYPLRSKPATMTPPPPLPPLPTSQPQDPPSQHGYQENQWQQPVSPLWWQPGFPNFTPIRVGQINLTDHPRRLREQTPPPIQPRPTNQYMECAATEPKLRSSPQPLLIVFDLNGTLIYRRSRSHPTSFVARPGLAECLKWLTDEDASHGHGHRAMVWSSAKPENVNAIVNKLFSPFQRQKLVAVWARDTLGLTNQQYCSKVQVYKELEKVWKHPVIGKSHPDKQGGWNQTNTVLVDDSIFKAASEPFNLLQVSEFENKPEQQNDVTLQGVRAYIDEAAQYENISAFMKRHPFSRLNADEDGPGIDTKDGGVPLSSES